MIHFLDPFSIPFSREKTREMTCVVVILLANKFARSPREVHFLVTTPSKFQADDMEWRGHCGDLLVNYQGRLIRATTSNAELRVIGLDNQNPSSRCLKALTLIELQMSNIFSCP
jgi:hypothetical protein